MLAGWSSTPPSRLSGAHWRQIDRPALYRQPIAPCRRRSRSGVLVAHSALRATASWSQPLQGPLVWQSDYKQAANHDISPALRAPWRIALLSDGSIVRHLETMTDGQIEKVPSLMSCLYEHC